MQTLGHQQSVSNYVYNPDPTLNLSLNLKLNQWQKDHLKPYIYMVKGSMVTCSSILF